MAQPPRILWANSYCLVDTTSGAAMAAREMLRQLAGRGWAVKILGAANFDHPRGVEGLGEQAAYVRSRIGDDLLLADGPLEHHLLVTAATRRALMSAEEEGRWYSLYEAYLETFRPQVVMLYGGKPLDYLVAAEARRRGIAVVFYVANGSYLARDRWCRDADLVITDSQATASLYRERLGLAVTPLGAFIDPAKVVAASHSRSHLLFMNPVLEKGAAIVIRLALMLEKRRPDIPFEVVESRGSWAETLLAVTTAMGEPRSSLANVTVTPNTRDPRPLYGRARLLLAPSLWWESAGRVLAEAMLNGIPAVITDNGGMPGMIGDAGIALKLDAAYHQPPYTLVPGEAALEPLLAFILRIYDDPAEYARWVDRAYRVGGERHRLEAAGERLIAALTPLLTRHGNDIDGRVHENGKH